MNTGLPKTSQEALNCKTSAVQRLSVDFGSVDLACKLQSPLMNRVYANRSRLMHKIVSNCASYKNDQLLLIGAGLDCSYEKYFKLVYAVDLPAVIEQRRGIIGSVANLIPADVTQLNDLFNGLSNVAFSLTSSTVVLIECVLSYIYTEACECLLHALATITNSFVVLYDPMLQSEGGLSHCFSHKMRSDFKARGAPLLQSHSSIGALTESLCRAGWRHSHSVTVNQAVKTMLTEAERSVPMDCEPFDEFASLAAIQNHYSVSVASNSTQWFQQVMSSLSRDDPSSSTGQRVAALSARLSVVEARLAAKELLLQSESQYQLNNKADPR